MASLSRQKVTATAAVLLFLTLLTGCGMALYPMIMGSDDERHPVPTGETWGIEMTLLLMYGTILLFATVLTLFSSQGHFIASAVLISIGGVYVVFYTALCMCDRMEQQLFYKMFVETDGASNVEPPPPLQNDQMTEILSQMQLKIPAEGGGGSCSSGASQLSLMYFVREAAQAFQMVGKMVFFPTPILPEHKEMMVQQFGGDDQLMRSLRSEKMLYASVAAVLLGVLLARLVNAKESDLLQKKKHRATADATKKQQ